MIYNLWHNFITSYRTFIGTGSILVLFVVSLYIYYAYNDGENITKPPFIAGFLGVLGTIGAALSNLIFIKILEKAKIKRVFIIILCFFVIAISGRRILSPVYMEKADNRFHIDSELKEAMDFILPDSDEGLVKVVTMPGAGDYFRAYSSKFQVMFEDDFDKNILDIPLEYQEAYSQLLSINPDMRIVSKTARDNGYTYIIIKRESYWPEVPLTNYGYKVVGSFGEWDIYQDIEN